MFGLGFGESAGQIMPNLPDDWERTDRSKFLLYGGAFTVFVDALLYPLELVKTRIQVETKVGLNGGSEDQNGP